MPAVALRRTVSWPVAVDARRAWQRPHVSAALVAHELAQPLAALTANLDAIAHHLTREPVSIESVREIVADAVADVARADRIVRHVLALVHRERTTLVTVDVPAWLDRCAARHRAEAARLGIRLETSTTVPLQVHGDVVQLERALDNVVVNAVQAIASVRDHGCVVLGAYRDGGHVEVTVADDGPGFHAAVLAASPALVTSKDDGCGLGLTLARLALEAHGGQLALANRDVGAVVTLRLPAHHPGAR